MKVVDVRALFDHMLWVRFDTGEEKVFDCKPMLMLDAFRPLRNPTLFKQAAVVDGSASWLDGAARIYASFLYDNGI
ncbi:MAG: DUF2442 domain-containing protein [Oscillospiraceae bacterium]|nr:DUF2442 domain-containing protein [Oscillospiraceae bacterium]